jgi:endo-1,4-beta-xylanase
MICGLKDAWGHAFHIGAAVSGKVLNSQEADDIITRHFSTLTAENAMKFGEIHPEECRWDWEETDRIAAYARQKGLVMRGHSIIFHNQTPRWLFRSGKGDEPVSKKELFKRLEDHITALTQRYNNIVYAWDVLNEVIDVEKGDDKNFRRSSWYRIGGRELYEFAFKLMREACPNAKLFYNDYNIEEGEKLEAALRFLSGLLDSGIPVHGVGIQGHWYYNYPNEDTLHTAIERYAALGLDIEFTEVDISAYEYDDKRTQVDYFPSMPEDRLHQQAQRYREIFRIAANYPAVKNITTWGIADNHTWLDNFPVPGRKNWPLLFDQEYRYKDVVSSLVETGLCLSD